MFEGNSDKILIFPLQSEVMLIEFCGLVTKFYYLVYDINACKKLWQCVKLHLLSEIDVIRYCI